MEFNFQKIVLSIAIVIFIILIIVPLFTIGIRKIIKQK